jgi:hypothetical protein
MVRAAGIPDSTTFHLGHIADKLRECGFSETVDHTVSHWYRPKNSGRNERYI